MCGFKRDALEDELCEGKKKEGVLTEVRASLPKDDDHLSGPKANLPNLWLHIVILFFLKPVTV